MLSPMANVELAKAGIDPKASAKAKAMSAAQDFEAVFLNSMVSQMFTAIEGEGPFGGAAAAGAWRPSLSEEYPNSSPKPGGIGIASQVYQTLLAQQEARTQP